MNPQSKKEKPSVPKRQACMAPERASRGIFWTRRNRCFCPWLGQRTIADVLKQAAFPGGFYHHFTAKEDLAVTGTCSIQPASF